MNEKPILKWAGGKRWLVPLLKDIWQSHSNLKLVEPFSGGLAVALGLNPDRALLNDANAHLINFYQQVAKGLKIPIPLKNESAFYYEKREEFNALIRKKQYQNKKAAGYFYFLIKTGFNGLCRFNNSGEFNVPFGQHKTINYKNCFMDYKDLFGKWDFTHGDFENIKLAGNEFLYVDPPYDVEFTKYYAKGFTWEDQVRLAHWLVQHQGPVIASNQATKRVLKLYKKLGFTLFTLPAPRMISCTGDRQPAIEMLALRGISVKAITTSLTQRSIT